MTVVYFPAIIERGNEGFGVFFPDLKGCVSAGDTIQETAIMAQEVLSFHLLGMAHDKETIPTPSDLDTIAHDPDIDEVARLLVPCELPGRKMRVNVMLDEGLLSAIDKVDKNRSRFLDSAARSALASR